MLEVMVKVHKHFPLLTWTQATLAVSIAEHFQRTGEPHSVSSLARACGVSVGMASRVAWSLTKDGGAMDAIRIEPDPKDRRKKLVFPNPKSKLLKLLMELK